MFGQFFLHLALYHPTPHDHTGFRKSYGHHILPRHNTNFCWCREWDFAVLYFFFRILFFCWLCRVGIHWITFIEEIFLCGKPISLNLDSCVIISNLQIYGSTTGSRRISQIIWTSHSASAQYQFLLVQGQQYFEMKISLNLDSCVIISNLQIYGSTTGSRINLKVLLIYKFFWKNFLCI